MAALGEISATTLEGALLEIAIKLQTLEAAAQPKKDNVQVVIDADDKAAAIRAELPVNLTTVAAGLQVSAAPYV